VRSISERVQQLADRLENTEPTELLEDVRRYARNKPGMFLMGAMAAGFVGGRLVKGATADEGSAYGATDRQRYTGGRTYPGDSYSAGTSGDTWTSPGATGTGTAYGSGFGGTAAGTPTEGVGTGVGYSSGFGAETYPEEPRQNGDRGGSI